MYQEQTGEDESENTVVGKVSLVNRAVEKLKSDKGFEPSLSELSGYTGVDEEELEKLLELIKRLMWRKINRTVDNLCHL